ncbi:UNVERIFIED_CONTAM: hypothetical protein Sradi_0427600 [Sesamum radiatum]|uniref:Uncharacterized protein n=1 Tax=Sesamum radiatum TaxID=300843 RepID=A0AAW2W6H9_SESRA
MSIISAIFLLCVVLSLSYNIVSDCDSCYVHQYVRKHDQKFEQKNKRFWEFNEQANTWVEVGLPYDLVSCTSGDCRVVSSIQGPRKKLGDQLKEGVIKESSDKKDDDSGGQERSSYEFLPVRKRISLTRMSETSIWVTGESGSIYERFWNGLQWVIAPHDLPVFAGYAVSVFIVNQTILALSEAGMLYQMQLTEDSQPIWVEFMLEFDKATSKETVQSSEIRISAGVISNDRERMYFCIKNGLLLELLGVDPPRWANHGRPPGANVAAVTDAATVRPGLLFTVSDAGDLYEYDQTSKPPWKKHINRDRSRKDTSLAASRVCTLHELVGAHSFSLFLLTKGGELIERRLHQRKWKWFVHGNPKGHPLTSITCSSQEEPHENSNSLFLTSAAGFVFEYHIQKHPDQDAEENWLNHNHPPHAKAARGIAGLQLHHGRMIFPMDDGRLAELHLSGLGGESLGPNTPVSTRRKSLLKYVWSLLDAPETEGWNAEYCTEERGPSNCISGTKDETGEVSVSRWRKDSKTQQNYLSPGAQDGSLSSPGDDHDITDQWSARVFRLRLMQREKSFFLITDNGLILEYLNTENAWFWLRHEHSTGIKGALGNYNGSLFVVDEHGSLLIRERSSSDLAWINCTAMRKGRQVIGGPPFDGTPRTKPDDAIFFVSRSGRLLQFTVGSRKFKWKDCRSPAGMKIASIVDQEGFRENIVFVVGRNGRLYQYNKVTELWHEHYQSQHLVLSRSPGTAVRSSILSLKGSLFMISEDGGLVEYRWSSTDGWDWIEHGPPHTNVTLVGAPGPCFGGNELFLIGSDGNVYLRYLDQGEWKWRDCGFPYEDYRAGGDGRQDGAKAGSNEICVDLDKNCDHKVSSTRPIPFSEDSIIFELEDGRLAEMKRMEDGSWIWLRTIGTPTSLCMADFWTSWAA